MTRAQEFACKLGRIRALLGDRGASGVALQKQTNLAWLLGGAEAVVGRMTEMGNLTAVVTLDACRVLMNNVEAPRLLAEELDGLAVEPHVFAWHEDATARCVREWLGPSGLSDTGIAGTASDEPSLIGLQAPLTDAEVSRYRSLARDCAAAVGRAMRSVCAGMSEHEIAGLLAREALARGIMPAVVLVAVDERTGLYRHPLPTAKRLERYAMGVMVGRRGGLHASLTRSIHVGPVPEDLARRHAAAQRVDGAILAATRPGATAGEVFAVAQAAYAAEGRPDEWTYHHQGGATGYQPRTWRATPGSSAAVLAGQAFAWNPTFAGAKSEDTALCTDPGCEILTQDADWPTTAVTTAAGTFARPDILAL